MIIKYSDDITNQAQTNANHPQICDCTSGKIMVVSAGRFKIHSHPFPPTHTPLIHDSNIEMYYKVSQYQITSLRLPHLTCTRLLSGELLFLKISTTSRHWAIHPKA